MNPPKNGPFKIVTPHEIAQTKLNPGGTKMTPPQWCNSPRTTSENHAFFEGEENKDQEDKNHVVVVEELTRYFQSVIQGVREEDVHKCVKTMLLDDMATEEDIKKAIDYTAKKRVTHNVLGYVREAVRKRYWESVSIPNTTTKKAVNRTYTQSEQASSFQLQKSTGTRARFSNS